MRPVGTAENSPGIHPGVSSGRPNVSSFAASHRDARYCSHKQFPGVPTARGGFLGLSDPAIQRMSQKPSDVRNRGTAGSFVLETPSSWPSPRGKREPHRAVRTIPLPLGEGQDEGRSCHDSDGSPTFATAPSFPGYFHTVPSGLGKVPVMSFRLGQFEVLPC